MTAAGIAMVPAINEATMTVPIGEAAYTLKNNVA